MSYILSEKIKKVQNLFNLKIIFWVIFYTGLLIGSINISKIDIYFENFSVNMMNFKNILLLLKIIIREMQIIILLLLSSFSILGVLISFLFVFLKGLGLGIILSQLYTHYLFKGIVFGMFVFLPGAFVSSMSLVNFASESFKFSLEITKKMLPCSNEENLWILLKPYTRKLSKFLFLSSMGAIVTIMLGCIFSKFFNF